MIYFVFHKCNHFSFIDRTKEKFQKKNPPLAFCWVGLRTCFTRRLRNSSGINLNIRGTAMFRSETLPLLKHPRRVSALCFVRYPAKRDGIASGRLKDCFID